MQADLADRFEVAGFAVFATDESRLRTVNTDRRRSKASRDSPQEKQEKPIGAPKIRPATPEVIELAKQTKEDHNPGLTA